MDLNTLNILRDRAKDVFALFLYQENIFTSSKSNRSNTPQEFKKYLIIHNILTINSDNIEFVCSIDREKLFKNGEIKYSNVAEAKTYEEGVALVLQNFELELPKEEWERKLAELEMKIRSYKVSYNDLKLQEQMLNDARESSSLNENQAWLYNLPKNIPNFKVLQQRIQDYMLAKTTNMTPIECGILYAQFSNHSNSESNQRLIKSIEDCLQSKYAITCDPKTDELYYFVTGLLYEYEPIPKEIFGSQVAFDNFIKNVIITTNTSDEVTSKQINKINFESFKKVKNY